MANISENGWSLISDQGIQGKIKEI